ncbi:hypothetical protein [Microbacterium lushaniae]|uniref:Transglycosylase SLT domain-containing protein n=1 Tax=Microbacterium lushaniae TaxID=2614639 RepID=A0A5J6L2Z1_9MICO|nr:hypothetical protein [Microbacterium lushaniae]QEW02662.1 hypothetical protein F6J85_05795 [Microbacterium lushaniae]
MGHAGHIRHIGLACAVVLTLVLPATAASAAVPRPVRAWAVGELQAQVGAAESASATASVRALAAAEAAARARAEADAASARASALAEQSAAAELEATVRRARLGAVASGLYRSAGDGPILAQLLTMSDPEALLGRLAVLERVGEASARSAHAARSAAEMAASLHDQAGTAAEERERLAVAAEAAAAAASAEAEAEAVAVAAASALDTAYSRLAAVRGTTPAREKQARLDERAEADATAPAGAGAGGGGREDAVTPAPTPPPAPAPLPPAAGPVMSPAEAQAHARTAISRYGWGEEQFSCLVRLWNRESGWRAEALNRSSGAYGIPQALPAEKMASAGPDWRTNAATQISWGLAYIKARHASPCGAWDHSQRTGWY